MKRLLALLAFAAAVGCHAQIPPSTAPTAVVTWTAPTNCTSACTYVISRVAATTTCPATTGTLYGQVGTATALTYTDSSVTPGTSYCWIVQAQLNGLTSQPSLPSNLLAIPPVPLAPGLPAAVVK